MISVSRVLSVGGKYGEYSRGEILLLIGNLKYWWVIHLETPSMDVPTYPEVKKKDI